MPRNRETELYSSLGTKDLPWPSSTVEWLPNPTTNSVHHLITGTRTSHNRKNYLIVHHVAIPEATNTPSPFLPLQIKIKDHLQIRIAHDGDIRRARVMPQNSSIIATQSSHKKVFIFDTTFAVKSRAIQKVPSDKVITLEVEPGKGNSSSGNSLSWNTKHEGQLLSTTHDGKVYLWDVNNGKLINEFCGHLGSVGGAQWQTNGQVFLTVGDDRKVNIWDPKSSTHPQNSSFLCHGSDINSLSVNPHQEFQFLTGSSDKTIGLWDTRKLGQCLFKFAGHCGEVDQVQWSPFNETVFASTSTDKKVIIWDTKNVDENRDLNRDVNGDKLPAGMVFVHRGHKKWTRDIAWNGTHPSLKASVGEDWELQVWEQIA